MTYHTELHVKIDPNEKGWRGPVQNITFAKVTHGKKTSPMSFRCSVISYLKRGLMQPIVCDPLNLPTFEKVGNGPAVRCHLTVVWQVKI